MESGDLLLIGVFVVLGGLAVFAFGYHLAVREFGKDVAFYKTANAKFRKDNDALRGQILGLNDYIDQVESAWKAARTFNDEFLAKELIERRQLADQTLPGTYIRHFNNGRVLEIEYLMLKLEGKI